MKSRSISAKMMTHLLVPYEVLIDESKATYRSWGMGRTNLFRSVLSPTLGWHYLKLLLKGERFLGFAPDMLQLGGDFIVWGTGGIVFAHRMRDNGDRVTVSQIISELSEVSSAALRAIT